MYTLESVKLQTDLGLADRGYSDGFPLGKKDVTVTLKKNRKRKNAQHCKEPCGTTGISEE